MYVYKLIDESGTFIGSSIRYPSSDPWCSKQAKKMDDPELHIISSTANKDNVQLVEFNEAINEILSSDKYDLLNGKFNAVDSVMKYMGRHFILVVSCESTRRVYITSTYNPVEKLYSIFVSHRGRSELVNDVIHEGKDNFVVDIVSTFDNPYHEMLRMFNSYIENGYSIYNEGTYHSLESASRIVEKLNNPSYLNDEDHDYKKLSNSVVGSTSSIISKFNESDDGSCLTE